MQNLHDKKTKNYKILVALAMCVLNRKYVIRNCAYCLGHAHDSEIACYSFRDSEKFAFRSVGMRLQITLKVISNLHRELTLD